MYVGICLDILSPISRLSRKRFEVYMNCYKIKNIWWWISNKIELEVRIIFLYGKYNYWNVEPNVLTDIEVRPRQDKRFRKASCDERFFNGSPKHSSSSKYMKYT